MIILEIILNIILEGLLGEVVGLNVRYYFLKLFNPSIKKNELSGNKSVGQSIFNFLVGLSVFSLFFIGLAYLIYHFI